MSNINNTSSDLKSQFLENRKTKPDGLIRYCGNCKKEYSFEDVMKKYPELIQDYIIPFWNNLKVKFYCSYCYLLKLIKVIKKNKEIH